MDVTSYTENYLRLHLLEIKGCTPILKCLVLKVVNDSSANGDVDEYLKLFENDIKNNKPPKTPEYKMLFPSNGKTTDVDKWDIALLVFVLVHCCTLDGQLSLKKNKTPNALLKKEIDEQGSLYKFLSKNKDMSEQLKSSGEITDEQYDRLDPRKCQPTNTWDIELILRILFKLRIPANFQILKNACNEVVVRKVTLCNETNGLKAFLTKHKSKVYELKRLGKLTDSQYEQLFSNDIIPDIGNWEDGVLLCIVIHVCQCFSDDTYKSLKTIREMRNALFAHNTHTEIDNEDFKQKWDAIVNAITTTVKSEKLDIDVNAAIRDYRDGPLDVKSVVADVKEYYTNLFRRNDAVLDILCSIESNISTMVSSVTSMEQQLKQQSQLIEEQSQQIKELNRKLDEQNKYQKELNEKLEEERKDRKELMRMVEFLYNDEKHTKNYRQQIQSQEIPVKFDITSNTLESAKTAERAVFNAFKQNEDTNSEIQDSTNKIQNMYTGEDREVSGTKIGSVILVVRCSSLQGVHTLLRITNSADLQTCLRQLEYELNKITECPIRIDASIPSASLQKMIDLLENTDLHLDETINSTEAGQIQDGTEMLHHTDQREESTDETSNFTEAGQIQNGTQTLLDTDKREETRDETGNFTVAGQIQDSKEMLPDTDQPEESTDETSNSTEARQIEYGTEMLHHTDQREESTDETSNSTEAGQIQDGTQTLLDTDKREESTDQTPVHPRLISTDESGNFTVAGQIQDSKEMLPDTDHPEESTDETSNSTEAGQIQDGTEMLHHTDQREESTDETSNSTEAGQIQDGTQTLLDTDKREKSTDSVLDISTLGDLKPKPELYEALLRVGQRRMFRHRSNNWWTNDYDIFEKLLRRVPELKYSEKGIILEVEVRLSVYSTRNVPWAIGILTSAFEGIENDDTRHIKGITDTIKNLYGHDSFEIITTNDCLVLAMPCSSLREIHSALNITEGAIQLYILLLETELTLMTGCRFVLSAEISPHQLDKLTEMLRASIITELKEKLKEESKDRNEKQILESLLYELVRPGTGFDWTVLKEILEEESNDRKELMRMVELIYSRMKNYRQQIESHESAKKAECAGLNPIRRNEDTITEQLQDITNKILNMHTGDDLKECEFMRMVELIYSRMKNYRQQIESQKIAVKFDITSNNLESAKKAERAVFNAFKQNEDTNTEQLQDVTNKIQNMYTGDGLNVCGTETDSVILVRCSSLQGVHTLLRITDSADLQTCLRQLEYELNKITECPIRIDASITSASLQKMIDLLENIDLRLDETSNSTEAGQIQDGTEMLHHTDQREESTDETCNSTEAGQIQDGTQTLHDTDKQEESTDSVLDIKIGNRKLKQRFKDYVLDMKHGDLKPKEELLDYVLDMKHGDLKLEKEFQVELEQEVGKLVNQFHNPTRTKQKDCTYSVLDIKLGDLKLKQEFQDELVQEVGKLVNRFPNPTRTNKKDGKLTISDYRTIQIPAQRRPYGSGLKEQKQDLAVVKSENRFDSEELSDKPKFLVMESVNTSERPVSPVRRDSKLESRTITYADDFISSFSDMTYITSLTLSNVDFKDTMATFPIMERMHTLTLNNVRAQENTMANFISSLSNMPHLARLTLVLIDLKNSQTTFPVMESMQSLVLSHVNGQKDSMVMFLTSVSNMKYLSDLSIIYVDLNNIQICQIIDSVQTLTLDNVIVSEERMPKFIASLSGMINIEELSLSYVNLNDSKTTFPAIDSLTSLKLNCTKPKDGVMSTIISSKSFLTNLTSLTLTKVIFENSEIAVSSTLKPSDCRACDGTMNGSLAALEHLTSLTIKDTNLGNSKSTFPTMHNIQVLTLDKIQGEYDTLFFFLVSLTNLRKMTSAALLSNKINFPLQITLNEITLIIRSTSMLG